MTKGFIFALFVRIFTVSFGYLDEANLPTKCHVCKYMTRELSDILGRTDKSHDVLYMGQVFQKEPKKVPYRQSELRLTEALENACANVLEYKVHKDKPLALRYEKGILSMSTKYTLLCRQPHWASFGTQQRVSPQETQSKPEDAQSSCLPRKLKDKDQHDYRTVESTTFKTLKGLKERGVKVDLGFPDQMWDTPDAEVTRLKSKCEEMVERYEDDISHWYYKLIDTNLTHWLCVEKSVLKSGEIDCLNETATTSDKQKITNKQEGKKIKTKSRESAPLEKEKETGEGKADEKLQPRISSDQFRRSDERRRSTGMNQSKRSALRDRLRAINDPDRLRREIRKIRKNELSENDYHPTASWEGQPNKDIPGGASRDMRKRPYDQLNDIVEFRREIENRVADLNRKSDIVKSVTLREVLGLYSKDASEIRDERELQKRLEDLDALVAILGNGEMRDEL